MLARALVVGLAFLGFLFAALISHELLHLVNSEPPKGICIGNCWQHDDPVIGAAFATGYDPFWLSHEWQWAWAALMLLAVVPGTAAVIEFLEHGRKCRHCGTTIGG